MEKQAISDRYNMCTQCSPGQTDSGKKSGFTIDQNKAIR